MFRLNKPHLVGTKPSSYNKLNHFLLAQTEEKILNLNCQFFTVYTMQKVARTQPSNDGQCRF